MILPNILTLCNFIKAVLLIYQLFSPLKKPSSISAGPPQWCCHVVTLQWDHYIKLKVLLLNWLEPLRFELPYMLYVKDLLSSEVRKDMVL